MKRFHVHVAVKDIDESVRFYSKVFGAEPAVRKHDYAKWMVEDPRINFAISQRGRPSGVNHLGIQVDDAAELAAMRAQLAATDEGVVQEIGTHCCYARSDKYWVTDPQGIAWETYHTLGTIPVFGAASASQAVDGDPCCAPAAAVEPVTSTAVADPPALAARRCCG